MKKLVFILLILLLAVNAQAVDWKTMNQATIEWDAVTTLADGSALPDGHTVKYRVYLDTEAKADPQVLADTDQLQYVVTLAEEGRFIVGVSAVRLDADMAEIQESEINWSNVNGEGTPVPFGFVHWTRPAAPGNLR